MLLLLDLGTPAEPVKIQPCHPISEREGLTSVVILKPAWASFITLFPSVGFQLSKICFLLTFANLEAELAMLSWMANRRQAVYRSVAHVRA